MKNKINIKNMVMLVCLMLSVLNILKAQDKITLINGNEINGKVIEISETEVRYKLELDMNGPIRVLAKLNVFSILYPNGVKDVFGLQPSTTKPEKNSDYVYYSSLNKKTENKDSSEFTPETLEKYSGPRFGFTYITEGTSSEYLTSRGKNPVVTQFGWQFEQRMFTTPNGISGILEFIPLVGGIEQGLFLPSANFLIGLRGGTKKSFEFAFGPNLSLSGLGMVFAGGTSFRSGKVNFPVNIAIVPSVGSKKDVYNNNIKTTKHVETGWRISVTVGFNSRKK